MEFTFSLLICGYVLKDNLPEITKILLSISWAGLLISEALFPRYLFKTA
jgi:hypothetical protein